MPAPMCITFQTRHRSRGSGAELPGRGEGTPFVNLGDSTEVVVDCRDGLRWAGMRFGLRERSHGRIALSNAHLDQLDERERWCMLGRQMCAVPIHGWRWTRGGDWVRSNAGWALGFYEFGFYEEVGGFLLVAQASSAHYQPIVVGWEDVTSWMAADPWDHRPMLRTFADRGGHASA